MIWTNISTIETRVQDSLEESTSAQSDLDEVESQLDLLDEEREKLRQNLTHLSTIAMDIIQQLTNINGSLVNVTGDSSEASNSGEELSNRVEELRFQANLVLDLSRQLNTSIETTRYLADHLVENTSSLVDHLIATVEAAQYLSDQVGVGLYHVAELTARLVEVKNETRIVFDSVLPSLDYAEELARNIEYHIIPEDQVADIDANATASQQIAQLTLELAQNASETVWVTQALINQLKTNLNSTETAQSTIQETLSLIRHAVDSFRYQLHLVRGRAPEVNETYDQVQALVKDTGGIVYSTTQLAIELQNRSRELNHQANINTNRSLTHQNAAEEISEEFSDLTAETEYKYGESVEILQNATSVLSEAQQLSNTTSQLSLQQLQQLLMEYVNERESIRGLREEAARLRSELQNLTSTFTQAARDLSNCYKTP